MCHVVLFMPVLALPVFWLLPLPQAAGVYGVVLFLSIFLYWKVYQAMRRPVITGKESLVRADGRVLEADRPNRPRVVVRNEIWNAESKHPLSVGEPVVVLSVRGLRLVVESANIVPVPQTAIERGNPRCHG
ncbi:MAG: hypothetical protein JRG73_19225 [Deltaproteobacteria bacterium]|nr:hypothetical protein [Deltaproteobacteria bacterium]MBW2149586.1 hypothetical protein [Deltaproteobacteria bacterium]MBW2309061.1 hypothetical protein [Deltaproteobacteria bacterium]